MARASIDQQRHYLPTRVVDRRHVFPGRVVERRPSDDVELVNVTGAIDIRPRVDKGIHDAEVRSGGCPVQRSGIVSALPGIRIGAIFQQHMHGVRLARFRGGVQRCPSCVRRARIARPEQSSLLAGEVPQLVEIGRRARVEETLNSLRGPPVDLGLERAPARKPVVLRDVQQRRRQPDLGIVSAKFVEAILGELPKILERGAFGQLQSGHDPSFRCARRPRSPGRKSGCLTRWCA